MTGPAPPTARVPWWTVCQPVRRQSSVSEEHWHIGAKNTRLGISLPLMVIGEKSLLMVLLVCFCGASDYPQKTPAEAKEIHY